jgi:hypothetical protein
MSLIKRIKFVSLLIIYLHLLKYVYSSPYQRDFSNFVDVVIYNLVGSCRSCFTVVVESGMLKYAFRECSTDYDFTQRFSFQYGLDKMFTNKIKNGR